MTTQEPSWKDSLSFLDTPCIEHEAGGQKLKFYALSLPVLFKLNSVAKPLATALTTLFTNTKSDTGVKDFRGLSEDGKGQESHVIMDPISVELASLRHKQRQEAVESLMSIVSEDNIEIVGTIIMDSLCDQFPRGNAENPPAKEFMSSVPLPTLPSLLVGVALANKGILGPLVGNFQGKLRDVMEKVSEQVATNLNNVSGQTQGLN